MKLVKSLLLGSAAGLAVVSGASAADLPSRKAAPAEYVRVCSAYGAGFFYIPGTDVCLKVGGLARFQAAYTEPAANSASPTGLRAMARFEMDARNPTAYGTLRAFVRVDVLYRTGAERSGSAFRSGFGFDNGAAADSGIQGRAQTHVILDKAFIQWGGFVAGRTNSLFAFNKNPEITGVTPTDALWGTNLIGYIATFGSGFYASLSAEDGIARRTAVSNAGNFATPNPPQDVPFPGIFNGFTVNAAGGSIPAGTTAFYAGHRMPDIVGAIGVEQSWGGAQISAAVHQIPVLGFAVAPNQQNLTSKYGWAVAGGLQINLPMIAPGDYLWVNAAYADGAVSYVHSNWMAAYLNNQAVKNSVAFWGADAYINPLDGSISKSKTWAIAAAFQHYWSPTLRSAIFGGYSQFNNPGNIADWYYWGAGANLFWSPVRALDIGGEVTYQRIGHRGSGNVVNAVLAPGQIGRSSDSAWLFRFRVNRSF